jgi:hypothetical protein
MKGALTAALLFLALIAPAQAVVPAERTSTVADRELVNVTIYNGGTALIHDRRRISLEDGLNRIAWRDVSANIDATSALLDDLTSRDAIRVLEQNFDYDLLSPSALLDKYVGRNVVVVHEPRFAGERETRETARLLSTNDGIVLQYADRIETQLPTFAHIAFPTATADFRDRPTLVLDLDSERGGPQTLDLTYLTNGLTWRVDYVGVMGPDETHLSLNGLVTLSNTSGVSYDDAHLQLVAGNVNIVQPGTSNDRYGVIAHVTAMSSAQAVQQENYFEYHLYTFPRVTTIEQNQTKQLTLLSAHGIPIRKTLELRGSPDYYRNSEPDIGDRLPIGVYVSFENKGGDLGIPLPSGIVRLYKNDSRGLSQFLGSDTIDHTPKNETVRLHLGDSFDVTAHKRQTDFRFINACSTASSYEIELLNAKSLAQDVFVIEDIPGQWTISDENVPHAKSSATTASWQLRVPADGRSTLKYTANVTWCSW